MQVQLLLFQMLAKTNVKTSSPLIILDGIDMSSDFDMNSLPPSEH